jgi:hypothetical protein
LHSERRKIAPCYLLKAAGLGVGCTDPRMYNNDVMRRRATMSMLAAFIYQLISSL